MRSLILVIALLVLQSVCAAYFMRELLMSILGIQHLPISWKLHEILEVGSSLGLIFGAVLGGVIIWRSFQRQRIAEARLRQVSGAFMELMYYRFDAWGLTSAERDVALFAIKGLSTPEIATLRGTAEGTVKAQTNAIYRKAGVTGRPQLLSLFIEDLLNESFVPEDIAAATPKRPVLLTAAE